jgi:hypothetical protein
MERGERSHDQEDDQRAEDPDLQIGAVRSRPAEEPSHGIGMGFSARSPRRGAERLVDDQLGPGIDGSGAPQAAPTRAREGPRPRIQPVGQHQRHADPERHDGPEGSPGKEEEDQGYGQEQERPDVHQPRG